MAKSLARVSITSSNLMPLLKDFKTEHEKYEKQSRATETGMF